MRFGAVIKYSGVLSKNLSKRTLNAHVLKPAYHDIGVYWHTHYRKKHFTHAGASEYGYTPRKGDRGSGRRFKGSYTAKKIRKWGHSKPLIWTGESERLTRIRDVRATSKGCRVVLKANKLNFRSRHTEIRMREEMTRISRREARELTKILGEQVQWHLANQFPPTTTRV